MFYLYLFKKYKSNCFLHDVTSQYRLLGMSFLIDTKYTPDAIFLTDPYHILKNLDNQDFPVDPGYYELKKQLEAVGMLTK